MNYHVADFVLRIKNASLAHRHEVVMPYSNSTKAIAKVLVKHGFLADMKEQTADGKKHITVALRYVRRRPAVTDVEILSKPSLRVYAPVKNLSKHRDRSVTTVISTSQGIMTGKEAEKKGIGGELLFTIW